MSTDLPIRVRAALDEHCSAAGLAPPDLADVRTRAARTSRLAPVAIAAAVVLILLGALIAPFLLANSPQNPIAPTGQPSLPDRFAGMSLLTGSVSASPPGPAIAYYAAGPEADLGYSQPMTLSAFGDKYRRLTQADDRGCVNGGDYDSHARGFLAPDGRRVAINDSCGTYGDLEVVDLQTGRSRHYPTAPHQVKRTLAWSPDGRYLAYFAVPFTTNEPPRYDGTLGLLDLVTGKAQLFAAYGHVRMAAFAPGGRQLAVQDGRAVRILDLSGRQLRTLDPGYRELVSAQAWTPDGSMLVTVPLYAPDETDAAGAAKEPKTYAFLGLDRPATRNPIPQVTDFHEPILGWRTPDTFLIRGPSGRDTRYPDDALIEVSARTGARTQIATLDGGRHGVSVLQLATNLVPKMTIQPAGGADRGPWPPWAMAALVVLVLVISGAGWLLRRLLRHPRTVGANTVAGRRFHRR